MPELGAGMEKLAPVMRSKLQDIKKERLCVAFAGMNTDISKLQRLFYVDVATRTCVYF